MSDKDKKVVTIRGTDFTPPPDEDEPLTPNEDVVGFLEELLQAAKEGRCQEILICYHLDDDIHQYIEGYIDDPYKMFGKAQDMALWYRDAYIDGPNIEIIFEEGE